MNHPNPYDVPDEPTCDCCEGDGCALCDWSGTLSQAAQREFGSNDAEQRKLDERRGK